MEFISAAAGVATSGYLGWIFVFIVLTAFEFLNAKGDQKLRSRVNGLAYWTVFIPLSAVLLAGLAWLWAALGLRPLLSLPAFQAFQWIGPFAIVIAVLAAAIVNDFFFYWAHRIQHRFLWRYHAVHHSIREMNAVNSYHHASEAIMSLLLYTVPTSLIVADLGPGLPFVSLAIWLHIVWIHSPTRANFGPLRALFVDNRFHRIHHSLEERHFDKNFGAFTTLWDRLFGTACFPEPGQWPAVGLAGIDEPRNVREWIDLPARYASGEGQGTLGEAALQPAAETG
jgi:sterol desaturase/sphingolipid hydroxylase (fatty acid hydroxylase superfamily)